MDIKGPWTDADGKMIKSFSGCRYSFVAIDRCSRKVIAFLVRSRSHLVRHITRLIKYVSSYGRKIKLIRTDNELFKTGDIVDYMHYHP